MENEEIQFYIPGSENEKRTSTHPVKPKTEKNQKADKVSDKELNRSIIVSVISILVCMTCLFGLTWAWYSSSLSAGKNKITAATFDLEITVKDAEEVPVTADEEGNYILNAANTYTVSLSKVGTAKTGFCLVSVKTPDSESATPYYTDSIPKITEETEEESENPFIFTVSGVSSLKFSPMWGKYPEEQADKLIQYNGTLVFGDTSTAASPEKPSEVTKTTESKNSEETEKTVKNEVANPSSTKTVAEEKTTDTVQSEKPTETAQSDDKKAETVTQTEP